MVDRNLHKVFLLGTFLFLIFIIVAHVIVDYGNYNRPYDLTSGLRRSPISPAERRLIENLIKRRHLFPYRRKLATNYSPTSLIIDTGSVLGCKVVEILNSKRNGFFVEYYLSDGIDDSNTILLERKYDWTGLLIQAPPKIEKNTLVRRRNRRAWVGDFCLSRTSHPTTLRMIKSKGKLPKKVVDIKCFPLEMALGALGRTKIDYLSLNSKGVSSQMPIIGSIPFKKIKIKVLSVEEKRNRRVIQLYLESKGFKRVKINTRNSSLPRIGLYVSKKLLQKTAPTTATPDYNKTYQ